MKVHKIVDSLIQVLKKAQQQQIFNHLMGMSIKILLFLNFNHQELKDNLTVKRHQRFNLGLEMFQKDLIIQKYNQVIQKVVGEKESEILLFVCNF